MYIELRQEIDQILLSQELSLALNVSPSSLNYQIEEPTDRQFGLLASNVAFIFSKKLKEREGRILSPQVVAESISSLISTYRFESSVDGGGFINLNPKREFIREYILAEPLPVNGLISVDWNSNSMLEKLRASDESLFFIRELSKNGIELTRADSLQLLSVLADSEISSGPYLKGFGGRENVPSYLLKFEEVIRLLPPVLGELGLSELNSFTEKLLLFRGRLEESVLRQHPERVMALALSLIREFFSEYNRPNTRRLLFEQRETPFLFYATSCGKQVLTALNAIKFSCQLPITVL